YNSYDYSGPFAESGVETVIFENGITKLPNFVCAAISNLKNVTIPDSVAEIGNYAFYNCTGLEEITLPELISEIGSYAFAKCTSLISVELPESIENIEAGAFSECSELLSIELAKVQSIGTNAFEGCLKLKSITVPNTLIKTDYNSYDYSGPFAKSGVETVIFEEGISKLPNYVCSTISNLKNVTIPDGVTTIGTYAFYNCTGLEEMVLPQGATTIGSYAFGGCSKLKKINLPDTLIEINSNSFMNCSQLQEVTTVKNSAGWKYFENCDVEIIEIPCSHPYAEDYLQEDANCTETGYTAGRYCPYCEIWVEGHEIIPAVGHIASDPVIENKVAATCTANGSYESVVYCKNCHEELSRTKVTTDKTAHKIVTIKATPATCTKTGLTEGKKCSVCGEILTAQKVVSKKAHNYATTTTKATTSKDGKTVTACTVCGKVSKTVVIAKASTVTLSAVSYTYDGKVKKPSVTVKNSKGTALKNGTDYTVTYASGRKNPGQYAGKVTFKGNYSGSKTLYFKILPGVTSKISATASASSVKLTWKAVSKATGYRVYVYNTSTKKYKALKTTTATSYTATKLKSGTKYKFAVKAYTTVNGKT
ncbi:MAG: leucine-rich repeat protein, partial [Acutalibacteraceae bacterium]